jgi:UDP-N-acetylmuramoylalanine--D-glutamate ligase
VYGLAVAGASVVRALQQRGVDVVVVDDSTTPHRECLAEELGVDLVIAPDHAQLNALVGAVDLVSPSPGVPETHRVIEFARGRGVPVLSEIELAYAWEQERSGGPRPMLAVTGTDGKTTTTLLAAEMLRAAGLRTIDAGNTATPLVSAIDLDVDTFVVECTSFRLAWTPTFRAEAAAWLNLAPDHLDWHRSLDSYEAAKAQVFANQRTTDAAIGFADDDAVMRHIRLAPGRAISFGLDRATADYHLDGDVLTGPSGPIAERARMQRSLPHDVTNALAASALVMESGLAGVEAIATALASFVGPPHRLEAIGTWGEVAWYNDSKATTPHSAAAAVRAFDSVVLIAGGKDKHVDLAPMAAEPERVRAVIAIGATRDVVAALFRPHSDVRTVEHLREAVAIAAAIAEPGDTVLLSPGCASLDQNPNFEARGDEFRSLAYDIHTGFQTTEGEPS